MPLEPKRPIRPTPPTPPSSGRADRDASQDREAGKKGLPPKPAPRPNLEETQESSPVLRPPTRLSPPPIKPKLSDPKPNDPPAEDTDSTFNHPIPPPSEQLQYRAIGLVRGQYQPSDEQFTRGILKTEDGTELDAVLLGRVMNLVRKYLNTEQSYLWVVYPRTRQGSKTLHVQIMGVWAPEEMGKPPLPETADPLIPDYFSIRGEVIFQSQDKNVIIVKIRQTTKKNARGKEQSFKLRLTGTLPSKGVGYFWEMDVQRKGADLTIEAATAIANVQKPQRRKKPTRPTKPGTTERPQLVSRDSTTKPAAPIKEHSNDQGWIKPIRKKTSR